MRTDQRFEEIAGSDFNTVQGAVARRVSRDRLSSEQTQRDEREALGRAGCATGTLLAMPLSHVARPHGLC
jgi:hypothetical protein